MPVTLDQILSPPATGCPRSARRRAAVEREAASAARSALVRARAPEASEWR